MNPRRGIHPSVLVKIFDLHPLSFSVYKILIDQRPGFFEFFRFIKIFYRKYLCLAAPAGRKCCRSPFSICRDQKLYHSVIHTFLIAKDRSGLWTVHAEPLRCFVWLNVIQLRMLQYSPVKVGSFEVAFPHITSTECCRLHICILKICTMQGIAVE